MGSPIGGLLLDATKRAEKKPNGHTSEKPCGCRVTVRFFTKQSTTNKLEPCSEHAPKKG